MSLRTFLALDLEASVLDALDQVDAQLDAPGEKIRWTPRRNRHVTLHFLGEIAGEHVRQVCEAAAEVVACTKPFPLEVRGVRCMPPRGPVRMVWADIADPSGALAVLHKQVGASLGSLGLRVEQRRFRPHVTLARVKFIRDFRAFRDAAARLRERAFGSQTVGEIVVYASERTANGPLYNPMARCALDS